MLHDDASSAARMRTLAQLAHPTAHELHGALNAVRLHLELLAGTLGAADPAAQDRRQRHLEVLREACSRVQRVADAFLALAALPSGTMQTDLSALVAGALEAARPLALARQVRLEGGPYPPIVREVPALEACRQRILDALLDVLAAAPRGSRVSVALAVDGRRATIEREGGACVNVALVDSSERNDA